jgi:hypothetical protein
LDKCADEQTSSAAASRIIGKSDQSDRNIAIVDYTGRRYCYVAQATILISMKAQNKQDRVTIDSDRITLSFGNMEPIVIPRRALRTRLQLVEWIYRLTGWPGMNLQRMRKFIAAVFRHHGWRLPKPQDFPLLTADDTNSSQDNIKLSADSPISHRRSVTSGISFQCGEQRLQSLR